VIVDIGQQESGEWVVIEVGDAQFAGTGQITLLSLWSAICQQMAL
jgi:ATP-grasp domain, R2K clade family 3